jgi:membrane associated rhomboid family serine protease
MLLLIPLGKRVDWKKRLPLVTLALIFLNLLVFFVVQRDDEARWASASKYYFASPLPALEFPVFLDYLEKGGDWKTAAHVRIWIQEPKAHRDDVLLLMQRDQRFLARLKAHEILHLDAMTHEAEWARSRGRFEELYQRVVTPRYSLDPARLETYVTSMFFHSGFGHLLRNMLFLFIAGFAVERVIGNGRFFFSYLVGGLSAAMLWTVVGPESAAIGASGAISAVMGMYAILFGLRKIRLSGWGLAYFDRLCAPAWVLLPLWLLNEFYTVAGAQGDVAYFAHIGGFLGGAVLAVLFKRLPGAVDAAYLDDGEGERQRAQDLCRGADLLGARKFDEAERVFEALVDRDPRDKDALQYLYSVVKRRPDSVEYHRVAGQILRLEDTDPGTQAFVHSTFLEYSRDAVPAVQTSLVDLLHIGVRFARAGYLEEAERILLFLLKRARTLPGVAEGVLVLAEAFRGCGNTHKWANCLRLVSAHYPESDAARVARRHFSLAH